MRFNEKYKKLMDGYISRDEYADILTGESDKDVTIADLGDIDIPKIINGMVVPPRSLDDMELVLVDTVKFDQMWKKTSPDFYIGPKGVGGIKKRYRDFIAFLMMKPEEREKRFGPIESSEVSVKEHEIHVMNGRHRFAVFRDAGVKKIPMAMDKQSIERAKKLGLV